MLKAVLTLSAKGDPILFVQAMRTLTSLFNADRNGGLVVNAEKKEPHTDLVDGLIDVLEKLKPHSSDVVVRLRAAQT